MDFCDPESQGYWYGPVDHIEPTFTSEDGYVPVDHQQCQNLSPVSDHSSYGPAPSLATSSITSNSDTFCDEHSLEDSFHIMPIEDLTPPMDYYPSGSGAFSGSETFALSRQSPSLAPGALNASYQHAADSRYCPHGCSRPFGRPYELNRHLSEQHQCHSYDCRRKLISFPSVDERNNHEVQRHGRVLGFVCGTCELRGEAPKPIPRESKLRKHFKDYHYLHRESGTFRCTQESCYPNNCEGGLFFTSLDELHKHNQILHGAPRKLPCAEPATTSVVRSILAPLSAVPNCVTFSKRGGDHGPQSEPKRWKTDKNDISPLEPPPSVDIDTTRSNVDHATIATENEGLANVSKETAAEDSLIEPMPSRCLSHLSESREKTFTVSILELHSLTKHHEWKLVLEKLARCNLKATFARNPQPAAIKLRGQCSAIEMDNGAMLLTNLINDSKPVRRSESIDHSQVEPKPILHQQCRCPDPILSMDPVQDSKLLAAWNEHFLRDFSRMVKAAKIEGSYSASLVRVSTENGTYPIIRFQSSDNQGPESRKAFEESVADFCVKHQLPTLTVQFTEGTLVRLMAGGSSPSVASDPPSNWRFPHSRRYWPAPGMGASIGPTGCPHVSATLGGYISLDGRLYMLSVDHFINICRSRGCAHTTKLRSPSISDLKSVRRQLDKKLKDIQLRIERSMRTDEIDLGDVQVDMFPPDAELELEQYKRIEDEMEEKDETYDFATVKQRARPSKPTRFGQGQGLHRMDWSLSEVTEPYRSRRQGKNMHRHGREVNPSIQDLEEEILHPYGTGQVCTEHGDVTGGEEAFYVGTTSGFRQGVVNPALVLYVDQRGEEYQEYSIPTGNCGVLRGSDFEGDSGAWIIRTDGVLIGLLWGWVNRNLLFTPIKDVFADILEVTKCRNIRLPENTDDQAPGLCARISCSISRDNSPERQMPPPDSTELSPFALLLSSIRDSKPCRRSSSSASSTFSLPSLRSSSSSVFEDIGPETPVQTIELKLPMRTKTDPLPKREVDWVVIKQEEVLMDTPAPMSV